MFIAAPDESADVERIYTASRASMGFTMNLTRAWAWRPDVFDGFAALRGTLTSQSTLSKRDQAVLVCAMASELGDAYCSLAWGRTLAQEAGVAAAAAVITNADTPDVSDRERALAAWARKVVADPNATSERDVMALRRAGLNDREIFEATVFIAFRQAFSTVNDALGIHPDRQLADQVPPEVRGAVTYGRPAAEA